ncbi:hypothetical protein [Ascidiaceihabitans sp.]|uniref:hypothetical protein n=1 Tax=Ascidiaceihabitans sp. TaxID=1872644 RepID=UPI003298369A
MNVELIFVSIPPGTWIEDFIGRIEGLLPYGDSVKATPGGEYAVVATDIATTVKRDLIADGFEPSEIA